MVPLKTLTNLLHNLCLPYMIQMQGFQFSLACIETSSSGVDWHVNRQASDNLRKENWFKNR